MSVAIEARYSALTTTPGSLSCGRAAQRVEAQPGQVCVDLGSGRGADTLLLAGKVGPTGHVWGVDLTAAMVEKARAAAAERGATNVTFLQADLTRLPLPDACADWVTSNCVLNHVTDKAGAWREVARLLKPGGRFLISDIYAVTPISEADRSDPVAVAECWAGAVLREEYLSTITAAGLVELSVLDEGAPRQKSRAVVASITLGGTKPAQPAALAGAEHSKEVNAP